MRAARRVIPVGVAAGLLTCAGAATGIAWMTSAAAGCGPGLAGTPRAGTFSHSLVSGGITRCYRLHVPANLDPEQPAALVFSLHGLVSNDRGQEYLSRWNAVADRAGFIVVYPQGTSRPLRWNSSEDFETSTIDDVRFLQDLLAELSDALVVDPDRVYVSGMSNGGAMTHRLACELADVFAAGGIVAGPPTSPPGGCEPSRPVPIIAFYGTDDPLVAYDGAAAPTGEAPWWARWMRVHRTSAFPPVESWIADWAARDGCDPVPERLPVQGSVSGIRYGGCAGGAEVILYTVAGGGHTWPGGGPSFVGDTTDDVSASDLMWDFFAAHPLSH